MTQVTVRNIDDEWVAKAKAEAREKGISMNAVLKEAIGRGLGVESAKTTNGLGKFAGDSSDLFDEGFDEAMADCSRIDPRDWE